MADEFAAVAPDTPREASDDVVVASPAAVPARAFDATADAVPEEGVAPDASAASSPSSEDSAGETELALPTGVAGAALALVGVSAAVPAAEVPVAAGPVAADPGVAGPVVAIVVVVAGPIAAVPVAPVPVRAAEAATVESSAEPPVLSCGATGLPFTSKALGVVAPAGTEVFVAAAGEALPPAGNWLPPFLPESLLRADFADASCMAPAKFEDEAAGWAFSLATGVC